MLPAALPSPCAPQLVPSLATDPLALDLLSRLLAYDPRQRLTASQALDHPWFREVRGPGQAAAAAASPAC